MGDFYKFKKILIILMIISCGFSIIKNIFKTHVEASEAVEVTPVWNDGNYTYQADNQFLTLRQNQIDIQNFIIYAFYTMYNTASSDTTRNSVKDRITNIYANIYSAANSGTNSHFVWFTRYAVSGVESNFAYQIVKAQSLSNIVYADATLDNGYKILSVPFYNVTRDNTASLRVVHRLNGSLVQNIQTGTQMVPVAELGCYSTLWVDLFKYVGVINDSSDYNNILNSIEETNELTFTQAYYTRELIENTYNSINNNNVTTISNSGISQPQVNEPDLSDAFDSITNILTNDNATTKSFTFTLPNNDSFNFSLDPNFLRTSLTRVGGGAVVTIIETLWYIGLYGLFIFTYLKIIGALLAGDLDDITGVLSPVNSVVNSSLEVTGAFRTSGGDTSAFRIRKG